MLNLKCPRCQHPAVLPPEMAGKPYQCTACQATLKIPGPKPATGAAPAPATVAAPAPAPAAAAKPSGIPPDHYGVKCPKCLTPVLIPKSMSGMDYECTECQAILKVPGGKKASPKPAAAVSLPDLPPLTFMNSITDSMNALLRNSNILTFYGIAILVSVVVVGLFFVGRFLDLQDAYYSQQLLFQLRSPVPVSAAGTGPKVLIPFVLLFWVVGQTALSHHALRGESISFSHFRAALPLTLRAILPYFFLFLVPFLLMVVLSAVLAKPSAPIRSEQDLQNAQFSLLLVFGLLNFIFQMTVGLFFFVGYNNELVARSEKSFGEHFSSALSLLGKNYLRIAGYTILLNVLTSLISFVSPLLVLALVPVLSLVPSRIYFGLVAEAEARGD